MLITYDYGHGKNTSGKRSPKGEREWIFNKAYGDGFVAQMKKYKNVTLKMVSDPTGKVDTPLKTRTNSANNAKSDLHISFHCNANTGKWGAWGGTEVHVYKNASASSKSYKLAVKVAPVLAKAMGLKNRGVKKTNLHITRETTMTCILIENGFMDSTTDIVALRNDKKMYDAGVAIAKAVAEFYGLKLKPTTTTTKPATTTTSNAKFHTVKSGDTLYGIAKKYGTTVAKITALNGLKTTTLSIGQKLQVSGTVVKYHIVKSGDTLYALAKKYGTTVANIKSWNGMKSNTLSIGQKLIVGK